MKAAWQIKKLGEMCEVMNGGTPKTGIPEYWGDNNLWITPAEMGNRPSPYVSDTERKITDLGLRNCSAQMLPPYSVILSSRAPIGHLVINTEPMSTNQGCKGLIPCSLLQHKFLYYYLSSNVELLNSLGTGATFKELSGGKLKEVTIPLPTLPIQKRIVSILDETFAAIATAKENTERNLQNARALTESYLQTIFAKQGDGWEEKQLRDMVSEMITGPFGSMLHKSDYVLNGVPVVNPQNIVNGNIIPLQTTMISQQTRERLSKYILKENDLIVARRGEMGRCAIVTKGQVGWLCGTGSLLIRVKKNINEKYLAIMLGSEKIKSILENDSIGTTMSNLNQGILLQIKFPLPSLLEQHSIIGTFDALSTETKKLEIIYKQILSNLEELKTSILKKAFNGELSGEHL